MQQYLNYTTILYYFREFLTDCFESVSQEFGKFVVCDASLLLIFKFDIDQSNYIFYFLMPLQIDLLFLMVWQIGM